MTDPGRDPVPGTEAGKVDEPAGCGVQGCLLAAVGLFVVLLIAMLVIAAIRFSSPPQPRFGMLPADVASQAGAPAAPAPPSGAHG